MPLAPEPRRQVDPDEFYPKWPPRPPVPVEERPSQLIRLGGIGISSRLKRLTLLSPLLYSYIHTLCSLAKTGASTGNGSTI